jgi:hypothetical protein
MDRVKMAIQQIPRKQSGEEPATERQLGYLRSFGYFSESTIRGLGMWQASFLIDQAVEIRDEVGEIEIVRASPKSARGCGCLSVVVIAAGLIWWVAMRPGSPAAEDQGNDSETVSNPSEVKTSTDPLKERRPAPRRPEDASKPSVAPDIAKTAESPPNPKPEVSFEGATFPISVETTGILTLLDPAGKETPIPIGSVIRVTNRAGHGILTMEIGGAVFVGSENRLRGNVKER